VEKKERKSIFIIVSVLCSDIEKKRKKEGAEKTRGRRYIEFKKRPSSNFTEHALKTRKKDSETILGKKRREQKLLTFLQSTEEKKNCRKKRLLG